MQQLEEQVLEHLRTLPPSQQQEVLHFIVFLNQQRQRTDRSTISISRSFTASASQYVGCLSGGPSDLSTNPDYMAGFGES